MSKFYTPSVNADDVKPIGAITPYPFQQEVINDVIAYIREEWAKCKAEPGRRFEPAVVEAYVSAGKTIMIGALAAHSNSVGARTLILSRTGELVEQNSDECTNMGAKNAIMCASLGLKGVGAPTIIGSEGTVANALKVQLSGIVFHSIYIDEVQEVDWHETMTLLADDKYETANQYATILAHYIRLNPRVAIIGFTGTPYRGSESIIGPFFKRTVGPKIDRQWLVENNYIHQTIFGYGDYEYDMHEYDGQHKNGAEDFSSSELKAMGDKADEKLTHNIMREVMQIMAKRNGALITCASLRHCKQAAEMLPKGSYGIVTTGTGVKNRREILRKAKSGEIKYVLQIGCLTTGVNVPFWDTSVILRRIGSLQLLTQLLGRGMRNLKDFQIELGLKKTEHLCLDYSGTMESMQQMFDDPILDDAVYQKAKKANTGFKTCPTCSFRNSEHARRCINIIDDERCEYFWSSKACPNCKTENDSCARICRHCDVELKDPNEKLSGKHYGPDDWLNVAGMSVGPTKTGAIYVRINFEGVDHDGKPLTTVMYFNPFKSAGGRMMWFHNFCAKYTRSYADAKKLKYVKTVEQFMSMRSLVRSPVRATYRPDAKQVHGLDFGSSVVVGGKRVKNT